LKTRWFAEDPRKIWSNPIVIAEDEIAMSQGSDYRKMIQAECSQNQKLKSEELNEHLRR
jgi:hypothetical protein